MGEGTRGGLEEILALSWAFMEEGRTICWAATSNRSNVENVDVYDPRAVRFCAVGSLLRACYELTGQRSDPQWLSVSAVGLTHLPPVVTMLIQSMNQVLVDWNWQEGAYRPGDLTDYHDTPGRKTSEVARLWSDAFTQLEKNELL